MGLISEDVQNLLGFGYEVFGNLFGFGQAIDADKGNFSLFGVFVQGFADQRLVSFDVENVVGNLESDADTAISA